MEKTIDDIAREFDHTAIDQMTDPYPLYQELRAKCPVGHTEKVGGFWFAATHNLVHDIEMDYKTFSSADGSGTPKMPASPMYPIDIDPPQQTKYRRILNPRFTQEAIEKWRPAVISETHQLIDRIIAKGRADLASELCRPLPPAIILPLIGIPTDNRASLSEWMEQLNRGRASDMDLVLSTEEKISAYLKQVIAQRRFLAPEDNILGDLLACKIDNHFLTDDDIFRVLLILLFGGLDTATSVMLEGLRYFADHSQQRERLRSDSSLWPTAVEELIRYTAPVQVQRRVLTKDTALLEKNLRKGESICLLYGSANRDETVFDSPDVCKIDRSPNPHLSFGAGAHGCIGKHLARLEIELLLKIVFERLPDYRVVDGFKPDYLVGDTRGLKSLPVIFTPGVPRRS
jgi:cytochrome P450